MLYQDMALRDCVELALDRNLLLMGTRKSLQIQESRLRAAEEDFLPVMELSAEAEVSRLIPEHQSERVYDASAILVSKYRLDTLSSAETFGVKISQGFKTGASLNLELDSSITENLGPEDKDSHLD